LRYSFRASRLSSIYLLRDERTDMSDDLPSLLYLFGRFLLGGLFVSGGVEHFFALPLLTGIMEARGVPAAKAVLILGSLWQIVFGLLLVFGVWLAPAAFALILFLLVASVIFLNFWDKQGAERSVQRNSFLANVAIIGALLMVAAQAL
jgi:putative oxidoreductase